jgi:hypothetical protein
MDRHQTDAAEQAMRRSACKRPSHGRHGKTRYHRKAPQEWLCVAPGLPRMYSPCAFSKSLHFIQSVPSAGSSANSAREIPNERDRCGRPRDCSPIGFSAHFRAGSTGRMNDLPQVICPSGIFVSSPLCKNISLHPSGKSSLQIRAVSPTEGRIAIVTDAGWDAVDAAAFCARKVAGQVMSL